ncbi:MAG: A/G-specific adenine glycosylase [Anaerolineae bacterium]|nr:A/G-specific adenine glycosylase [Anaerolineae bacterium]
MSDQLDADRCWFRCRLQEWGQGRLRYFPWRHTSDPYHIFVAEFLLQQTDAPRVIAVYNSILEKYPTIDDLAEASLEEMAEILYPLGFHFRSVRLVQSARIIKGVHDGRIPDTEQVLLTLPGVGPYMARSVCANAFSQPLAVLDTNVARILQRFFGFKSTRARARNDPQLWQEAQRVAPENGVGTWNLTLIDFGAMVCTMWNPKCNICPLQERCNYAAFRDAQSVIDPTPTQ